MTAILYAVRVCLIAFSFLALAYGLPVRTVNKDKHQPPTPAVPGLDMEEYVRYIGEMAKNDPALMERLSKIKDTDLSKLKEALARNPHLQERLSLPGQGVRNQYDEARRMNIDQMRELQRLQNMHDNKIKPSQDWSRKPPHRKFSNQLPEDYSNTDIQNKLRETQHMLEELDKTRKEDFKAQEMWKEHRRRQRLTEMNEQQRLLAEEEYKKKQEEMRHHEKLPQPGSKEQIEQVWKEEDGMPEEQFDPRTFFHMHDTNGDKVIDQMELEALFVNELKKVYKDKDLTGIEAHEDMARMREYALSKMDVDKNGLLSYEEFLNYMKKAEDVDQAKKGEEGEEWHPVVDEEMPYSDKEFEDYEEEYDGEYDYQYDDQGNVIGIIPRNRGEGGGSKTPPDSPLEAIKGDPAVHPPVQVEDPKSVHHTGGGGDTGGPVGAVDGAPGAAPVDGGPVGAAAAGAGAAGDVGVGAANAGPVGVVGGDANPGDVAKEVKAVPDPDRL